ncbi:MAG: hypothetical protein LBV57_03310 [Candidatus Symbiothrix sp.]|jgi:hypothetical protein|nr:hypothetical protein [Candidatus Symbiothrix sp.]
MPNIYAYLLTVFLLLQAGMGWQTMHAQVIHLPPDTTVWHPITAEKEAELLALIAEMNKPLFVRSLEMVTDALHSGYLPTAWDSTKSFFDIGPLLSSLSLNQLEGLRLRAGGTTTAHLHPNGFIEGYAAYGLKDRKWKYQTSLTYSFTPKKRTLQEHPYHYLSFIYQYDAGSPEGNSPLKELKSSFQTGAAGAKMQYIRKTELRYIKEWDKRFALAAQLQHKNNQAAGILHYNRFTTASAGLQFRWTPPKQWTFTISHQQGFKNILNSDFAAHYSELSATKRLQFASPAYLEITGKAGKVWNKAPFPLLILPDANPSIFIEQETFMMMRALEFTADESLSAFATCNLKGLLLNRIPLIHYLNMHEIITVNAIAGHLSDKNNPAIHPAGLFPFPHETRLFDARPYLEASIGLDNIFKMIRVDYFRRLTYLDQPHTGKWGIKIDLHLAF